MYITRRGKDNRLVLETISLSHYVEKVRWSLDILGVDYEEEQDAGIIGVFFTGRMVSWSDYKFDLADEDELLLQAKFQVPGLRIPGKNFTVYNSSDILRYLYGKYYNDPVR